MKNSLISNHCKLFGHKAQSYNKDYGKLHRVGWLPLFVGLFVLAVLCLFVYLYGCMDIKLAFNSLYLPLLVVEAVSVVKQSIKQQQQQQEQLHRQQEPKKKNSTNEQTSSKRTKNKQNSEREKKKSNKIV